ncbi:MAG TPA: hypothetical protein VGB26_04770 [Nitrospiria bacterium]|jgi:hypothetical protein
MNKTLDEKLLRMPGKQEAQGALWNTLDSVMGTEAEASIPKDNCICFGSIRSVSQLY